MAGPSVNVVLRLDSSKVRDDAEKAKGLLSSAINPTVDVFNVATKAVELFGKALQASGQALVFMTERTGAVQALTETLGDTRKALGEAADRSGALRTATEAIEEAARNLAQWLRSNEGREAINAFFGAISRFAANALDSVTGLIKVVKDASFELDKFRSQFNNLKDTAGWSVLKKLTTVPGLAVPAQLITGLLGNEKVIASRSLAGNPLLDAATDLADQLRAGGDTSRPGSGVRGRGTFRDDEAIKAAQDREAAEERALDAAVGRMDTEIKAGERLFKWRREQDAAEEALLKKQFAADMASLDHKRNIAELTRQVEEGKTETAKRNAERRTEITEKEADAAKRAADRQATVGRLVLDGASYTSKGIQQLEEDSKKFDESTKMAAQAGLAVSGTLSSVFTAMAQAIGSGEDIGKAVTVALGGAIASLGASAIAAGTYAVVMGSLSLAFPLLQAAFPSSGIPAGLAAIGLGGAMLAGGTYLASIASGGSATGPARGSATSGGGGYRSGGSMVTNRRTGFSGTPEGFAGASLAPVTTILNYNFNGPMGGSPRRIAREIRDLSTAGDTLLPGYRSPGGR